MREVGNDNPQLYGLDIKSALHLSIIDVFQTILHLSRGVCEPRCRVVIHESILLLGIKCVEEGDTDWPASPVVIALVIPNES